MSSPHAIPARKTFLSSPNRSAAKRTPSESVVPGLATKRSRHRQPESETPKSDGAKVVPEGRPACWYKYCSHLGKTSQQGTAMTVTIVTTPTPMAPTASIDDASGKLSDSGSALPGQGFASILLGQLVPLEQSTQATTAVKDASSEEAAASGDNVAVFAALTLAPQVAAASTTPETPKGESIQTTIGISKGDASLLLPTERQAAAGAAAHPGDRPARCRPAPDCGCAHRHRPR